jgi:hypothetical protein
MNRKNPHFKEWLKTWNEIQVLEDYKRNQNWIPLENPYRKGYWISLDLREDIKNRQDAWVFYMCIDLIGTTTWCKDKTMTNKSKKSKPQPIVLDRRVISEEKYQSLPSAVKKYFLESSYYNTGWNPFRKTYYCNVPDYFFVYKLEPRWITHYKEVDSLIEQEIDEKRDYILSGKNKKFIGVGHWNSYNSAPKSFCKFLNRSDRRLNKQVLQKNLMSEDWDKYEYKYNHKHYAKWLYW